MYRTQTSWHKQNHVTHPRKYTHKDKNKPQKQIDVLTNPQKHEGSSQNY